jgi:hypothetical protein
MSSLNSIFLHMPTGGRVLTTRQELGCGAWCLEYNPEIHDDELGSLKTEDGNLRTTYGTRSVEAMAEFRTIKEAHQKRNAKLFGLPPQELRDGIYQCTDARTLGVTDDTERANEQVKASVRQVATVVLLRPPQAQPGAIIPSHLSLDMLTATVYTTFGKKRQSLASRFTSHSAAAAFTTT